MFQRACDILLAHGNSFAGGCAPGGHGVIDLETTGQRGRFGDSADGDLAFQTTSILVSGADAAAHRGAKATQATAKTDYPRFRVERVDLGVGGGGEKIIGAV